MNRSLLLLLTFIFSHQIVLAQLLKPLDDGLTPKQRYTQGIAEGFAHNYLDQTKCSQQALTQNFQQPKFIYPNTLLLDFAPKLVTADFFIKNIVQTLNKALSELYRNGDSEVTKRRVCAGLYNYGEINARSYIQGYILVDPKVIKMMWNLPNKTSFSDSQVYLHELAHQIQYWHGNQFAKDSTSRRSELTADCIGSALLWLSWKGLSTEILSMESLGVVAASESVGDYDINNPDHHGTPQERIQLSLKGQEFSKQPFLTSKKILQLCEAEVKKQ